MARDPRGSIRNQKKYAIALCNLHDRMFLISVCMRSYNITLPLRAASTQRAYRIYRVADFQETVVALSACSVFI